MTRENGFYYNPFESKLITMDVAFFKFLIVTARIKLLRLITLMPELLANSKGVAIIKLKPKQLMSLVT